MKCYSTRFTDLNVILTINDIMQTDLLKLLLRLRTIMMKTQTK